MDCWSWLNAYKNRYGFYRVDLKNDFKRYPKASSFWLAEVAAKNALD
jgi:6-phospho-beta-glucosidase